MSQEVFAAFADLVANLRRRAGLTQKQLSERARLSVRTVREIEGGRVARPRRSTVALLAEAFELPAAQRDDFQTIAAQSQQLYPSTAGSDPPSTDDTRAQPPGVRIVGSYEDVRVFWELLVARGLPGGKSVGHVEIVLTPDADSGQLGGAGVE
jgi:transcriptional regulator with XRE-family HTH domain